MITLDKSLATWGSDDFKNVLKAEIESLEHKHLPLHLAICQGGQVEASKISALINSSCEENNQIIVQIGIFFNEVTAGCNCSDEPAIDNTYCDIEVHIDSKSAATTFTLIH